MNDLETDLKLSTAELHKLRDKVTEQNESLSTLNRELEQKGKYRDFYSFLNCV